MQLKVYNTLTRQKELFVPLMDSELKSKRDFVGIYSCGPTVYRDPHIGNMRAYFVTDMRRNTIRNILGYPLKHVVNITDVGHLTSDADEGEDKMEKGAKREGLTVREIAKKYEDAFMRYLDLLHIDKFDIFCRATEHIQDQIDMVKKLEEKGYTYIIPDDGVYMDTSKVPNYGRLARLDIAGLKDGARIENENRKNKTDFGLRKFSPKGEKRQMERDSPWGRGFPGWHIECSAMSDKYLCADGIHQFDIHTGGVDHIGVHHTNEIAQSEAAFGAHPRVKYRMHNQHLNLGGKKVSKSEGGLVTLDDVIAQGFDPLDLRYLYMLAHYRSFQDFSIELLEQAKLGRKNLISKIQKIFDTHNKVLVDVSNIISYEHIHSKLMSKYTGEALEDMIDAILDDLNTPQLIAILNQSLNSIDKIEEVDRTEFFFVLYRLEKKFLKIGLFDRIDGKPEKEKKAPKRVIELAEKRAKAKQDKDFALSDALRSEIQDAGREIKDTKDGYELNKT